MTVIWALFGNDEDGLYGIYPHTTMGAVRWWFRNPMHNLFWHVVNWPGGPFFERRWGDGWRFYIGWRPGENGEFGVKFTKETNL